MLNRINKHQNQYLDITIKIEGCRDFISSEDEYDFIRDVMHLFGEEEVDWFHQYPYIGEEWGKVLVADFAFPQYNIVIELDGKDHESKQKKEKDAVRDEIFRENGLQVIRIKTPIERDMLPYWISFIHESIELAKKDIEKNSVCAVKTRKMFGQKKLQKEIYKRFMGKQLSKYYGISDDK